MMDEFVLGTAQFGMAYGATNHQGMLSEKEVFEILECALENKISHFDTSVLYGSSLKRLANFFSKHTDQKVYIINKFSLCDDYDQTLSTLQGFLEDAKVESYDALLIHDPDQIHAVDHKKLNAFVDKVLELKLTTRIGCSIYAHEELETMMQVCPVHVVQCPVNPFQTNFLQTLAAYKNIEIHARSLFLQGVLLASSVPHDLQFLQPYMQEYKSILQEAGCSALEALLGWAMQQENIGKWVMGVTSVNELKQIIQVMTEVKKSSKKIDFSRLAKYKDDKKLDPSGWNQHE